jgi:predicted transposase YbfD/YdcC
LLHPKKVGVLPVDGNDKLKQTNEIRMFIPLVDAIDISGKRITVDVLLTQRSLASYLSNERDAHFVFTVKKNQLTLLEDIRLLLMIVVNLTSANPRRWSTAALKTVRSGPA